jgi:hypothetical protein
MGGMGGASDWVDRNLLGGATAGFGCVSGLNDAGLASGWDVAWEGAKWGDALVSVATLRPSRAVLANARRRGGKAHVSAVMGAAKTLAKRGYTKLVAGGGGPETRVSTPAGAKPYRYPDVIARNPRTGATVYGNVGRARNGSPIAREADALSDLRSTGTPTEFFEF